MQLDIAQRETIKSALRIRHGSVFAFEEAADLPRKSVSDWLRGRPNKRVAVAIANEVGDLLPSDKSDGTSDSMEAHRLNAGAR